MRPLCDLLTTWENWSARNTLTRALARVATDDARDALLRGLVETPEVDPLDALRDAAELVSLLAGWQWQAMHAARLAGTSWDEIGAVIGVGGDDARSRFVSALDRQEQACPGASDQYRAVAFQRVPNRACSPGERRHRS